MDKIYLGWLVDYISNSFQERWLELFFDLSQIYLSLG